MGYMWLRKRLSKLREVKGPVCVVSITGWPSTGKSYILSEAFDQPNVFPVGHRIEPETIGVWLWVIPEKYKDSTGQVFTVVLLDSEGFGALTVEDAYDYNVQTSTLIVLLSSVLIYNSRDVPKKADVIEISYP
ncbi:hypothetical protein OS493_023441 [Desmophyllum pertusum]|uniref:GB1/RHD3-type G domain-containing protein n=1 Tax=Desmophyllum pertusum TaxID=174260 RepID=A0A9X0D1W3_9CNID|nr:hypothetical protein OS493_023441 [Desmophyllum pertusum]